MSTARTTPARRPVAAPSAEGGLSLADRVAAEAAHYRRIALAGGMPTLDRDTAATVAAALERLEQLVRWTGAETPEDHEARMDVWEDEIRSQWFDRGYAAGKEAGR